jgi:hypothetical protein
MRLRNGLEPACLICAIRGLLNFIYISQLPIQSTRTLNQLDEALGTFHCNKSIFTDLGIREHWNIPKLHACSHYASSIRIHGTTNNYNTQATERLHIDLAKDAYRASNRKDKYPQMTQWLEHHEKIHQHEEYLWCYRITCDRNVTNFLICCIVLFTYGFTYRFRLFSHSERLLTLLI